ncbi:MAG: hypothetical protein ACNA8N_01990 [Trueperaceae bacterium]
MRAPGYRDGPSAGAVILMAQARLLLLMAVGVLLLRERDRLPAKLTAGALMLAGIGVLASGAGA